MAEPAHGSSRPGGEEEPGSGRTSSLLRGVQVLVLAAVAGLLALLIWRVLESGSGRQLVSEIRAGKNPRAPQFTLSTLWTRAETWPKDARAALGDLRLSLRELRGHPVVINFWASWCVPCAKEAPLLHASARAHRGQVAFLGIDINDFKSDARHFLRKYKVNYVSVRDNSGSTQERYGLTGVPETYYLNAGGRIVAHSPGQVSRGELDHGLAQAIGAGP